MSVGVLVEGGGATLSFGYCTRKASKCVGKSSLSVICGQVLVCIHDLWHAGEGGGTAEEEGYVCVCVY